MPLPAKSTQKSLGREYWRFTPNLSLSPKVRVVEKLSQLVLRIGRKTVGGDMRKSLENMLARDVVDPFVGTDNM